MRERISNFFKKSERTNYQTPSAVDLTDTLGFNPAEHNTLNEHGDFMNIGKEPLQVPLDIQHAFIEKIAKEHAKDSDTLIIKPDSLFYAVKRPYQQQIERNYMSWAPDHAASEQIFPLSHSLIFTCEEEDFKPARISYMFERKSTPWSQNEGSEIFCPSSDVFIWEGGIRLNCEEPQSREDIQIEYNDYEKPLVYINSEFQYIRNVLPEEGFYTIHRLGHGSQQTLKVPYQSPQSKVFETLFDDPRLLEDPLNAPVEADTSWKRANVLKAFNVTWHIQGIKPVSPIS